MKKAIVSVTNDLYSDRRVNKTCNALVKVGFDVLCIGRILNNSNAFEPEQYKTKRIKLIFNKGVLFYGEYNIRLFFYLLFRKADLLYSNDLDTLLSNFLVHKIKKTALIYDTHEYFTGVPELEHNKFAKRVWTLIEKNIFPKLKEVITVNSSISKLYEIQYFNQIGKNSKDRRLNKTIISVIRNASPKCILKKIKTREELSIPRDKKIIILQGAGINIDRGAEEAVEAMQYVKDAILLIIGSGDVIQILKEIVNERFLTNKVIFIPRLPYPELMQYTLNSDLGLTLDKDTNINYQNSLPNKVFDYIQAGIPILSSPITEVQTIIEQYSIGDCIENHDPKHIALKINNMLSNEGKIKIWKENIKTAQNDLCWENEELKLITILKKYA